MTQSFQDAGKAGKEFVDAGLKNFAELTKDAQEIGVEAAEYSKRSFETAAAAFEKLASARSFDKALEIQTDYVKAAYEDFVSQASRFGELYVDLAKQAYKPFENVVAKAR